MLNSYLIYAVEVVILLLIIIMVYRVITQLNTEEAVTEGGRSKTTSSNSIPEAVKVLSHFKSTEPSIPNDSSPPKAQEQSTSTDNSMTNNDIVLDDYIDGFFSAPKAKQIKR